MSSDNHVVPLPSAVGREESEGISKKMDNLQINVRKNLVIVRAGDSSLHPRWVRGQLNRSWDLIVNYYGDRNDIFREKEYLRIDSKGPKWKSLKLLIEENIELIKKYDYIWLPDDDIDADLLTINELFNFARKYSFQLCQPSLSHESYVPVWLTLNIPFSRVRFTNYVENMVPCFKLDALIRCLPTMDENLSGWGIDHVWPKLIEKSSNSIGVIDALTVTHTRPVANPNNPDSNYTFMKNSGKTPRQEAEVLLDKYNLTGTKFLVQQISFIFGLTLSNNKIYSNIVMIIIYRLIILFSYLKRNPRRWDIDNLLSARMNSPFSSPAP